MISTPIAIRWDLIHTGSNPSKEKSTDMQNHFRLETHYHHSLLMEDPNLLATTSTYLNVIYVKLKIQIAINFRKFQFSRRNSFLLDGPCLF